MDTFGSSSSRCLRTPHSLLSRRSGLLLTRKDGLSRRRATSKKPKAAAANSEGKAVEIGSCNPQRRPQRPYVLMHLLVEALKLFTRLISVLVVSLSEYLLMLNGSYFSVGSLSKESSTALEATNQGLWCRQKQQQKFQPDPSTM
jgi:hypothetical protein